MLMRFRFERLMLMLEAIVHQQYAVWIVPQAMKAARE